MLIAVVNISVKNILVKSPLTGSVSLQITGKLDHLATFFFFIVINQIGRRLLSHTRPYHFPPFDLHSIILSLCKKLLIGGGGGGKVLENTLGMLETSAAPGCSDLGKFRGQTR